MTLHFSGRSLLTQVARAQMRKLKPAARPLLPFFALVMISLFVVGSDTGKWFEIELAKDRARYAKEQQDLLAQQALPIIRLPEARPRSLRQARKELQALEQRRLQSEQMLAASVRQPAGGSPPRRITAKQAEALFRGMTFSEALRIVGPGYSITTESRTNLPPITRLTWWNEDKSYLMLGFEYGVVTEIGNNNLPY